MPKPPILRITSPSPARRDTTLRHASCLGCYPIGSDHIHALCGTPKPWTINITAALLNHAQAVECIVCRDIALTGRCLYCGTVWS